METASHRSPVERRRDLSHWLLRRNPLAGSGCADARLHATPGGAKISHVVLVESSVATPPEKIMHSNQWMLETVAADDKLMSVVGKLDA
ncbi:MAG: hypothetical protein HC802_22980, partial [Caldilineaceae bacterium]|nr:hypothetical protein [Caldilineaceae bacterium]